MWELLLNLVLSLLCILLGGWLVIGCIHEVIWYHHKYQAIYWPYLFLLLMVGSWLIVYGALR